MEALAAAIDVNLKDGTTPVNENDYLYITAAPQMPRLTASLKPSRLSGNAKWRLHIEYKRSPRNDDKYYPGPTASTWKTLAASASCNIASEFGADFHGGKATLYCDYAGTQRQMIFHIRGKNPTEAAAEAWIASQENQQQAEEPSMPLENYVFTFNGVNFQKGTARTPVDACAIQRYNGATLRVIYWKNKTATESGSWEIRGGTYREYVDHVCGKVNKKE